MSLRLISPQPRSLLGEIKKAIDRGHVETWCYDQDGDFTHTPSQWKNKAWLRPRVLGGELLLTTIAPEGAKMSLEVYAVYHGRFAEMALAHFDKMFTAVQASALPADGDRIG